MNFQAVEAANGELVVMLGTFAEVGGAQQSDSGKLKAMCKIRDDAGITHKVHLHQGNGALPTVAQINQRCQFSISTFQGTYQGKPYTGYSGFWNADAQVAPTTVGGYPKLPQPQQAPKEPDWDAICRGKVRHGVVCAFIQSSDIIPPIETIEYWVDYIMTGREPIPDPDPSIQEPGDDLPF